MSLLAWLPGKGLLVSSRNLQFFGLGGFAILFDARLRVEESGGSGRLDSIETACLFFLSIKVSEGCSISPAPKDFQHASLP